MAVLVLIIGVLIMYIIQNQCSMELNQLRENLRIATEDLKHLKKMHDTCSKELNSFKSDKEALKFNCALEQLKCQNNLHFKEEKLKDYNSKIEEQKNSLSKGSDFSKLIKEGRQREDDLINELHLTKSAFDKKDAKLSKCEGDRDSYYEKYTACKNKGWFS